MRSARARVCGLLVLSGVPSAHIPAQSEPRSAQVAPFQPFTELIASVVEGGNITYWGAPRVTPSIRHGGVIEQGAAPDADEPRSDSSAALAPVPPIPALPRP